MKKINLSQPVKVKLNERGKRIYKDRWGYNTQDGNGYTEMSLYSLMDLFGNYVGWCDSDIIIPDTSITEVPIGYRVLGTGWGYYGGPHSKYSGMCAVMPKKYARIIPSKEEAKKIAEYYWWDYEIEEVYENE